MIRAIQAAAYLLAVTIAHGAVTSPARDRHPGLILFAVGVAVVVAVAATAVGLLFQRPLRKGPST